MLAGQDTPPAPPAAQAQQPLKIGRAFIKQYYNCLLNSPAELCKFYAPDSTISRGMEPTAPTEPLSLKGVLNDPSDGDKDLSPGERMRRAFFDWADADDQHVRIDFASGAIDAQESREGFLIVVTGHMYLPKRLKEKSFVHTFILNDEAPPGQKKVFLLKNDILRFLDPVRAEAEEVEQVEQEEIVEGVLDEVIGSDELAQTPTPTQPQAQPVIVQDEEIFEETTSCAQGGGDVEPTIIEPVEFEPSADEEKIPDTSDDDEDGEEQLEMGNSILCDRDNIKNEKSVTAESPSPSSDGKKKRRKKRGSKSRSRSSSPEDTEPPEKPKAPGSWASLVASTGGVAEGKMIDEKGKGRLSSREKNTSKVSTPTPQAVDESKPNGNNTSATPTTATGSIAAKSGVPNQTSSASNRGFYNKRTPEATLFIRNIPDKTTEDQIKAMFEPHGQATGNKILGMNLIANRGFAFVDFDGTAAVDAIVKEAKESIVRNDQGHKIKGAFMVGNRVLVIEPKATGGKNNAVSGGVGGNVNKERRPYHRNRGEDG